MNIISFDVGIKNMAYCILSITNEKQLIIRDWNILNLINIEQSKPILPSCSCFNKPKNKKQNPTQCNKNAKYTKNDKYYCDKHAKLTTEYIIPTKEHTLTHLRKTKVDELLKIISIQNIFNDVERNNEHKMKKVDIIALINDYYIKNCFNKIEVVQQISANDIDLIQIGRNMKVLLDKVENIEDITHVLIENQLSPVASRMKTIQGMLAQYFIMKSNTIIIEFISSVNKLKQFNRIKTNNTNIIEPNIVEKSTLINSKYKEHKLDGIYYCNKIINNNESLSKWASSLNTKKKDDFADSFLQGVWYLTHNKLILYAEDLNIKIV
jgi:hypothetical protein